MRLHEALTKEATSPVSILSAWGKILKDLSAGVGGAENVSKSVDQYSRMFGTMNQHLSGGEVETIGKGLKSLSPRLSLDALRTASGQTTHIKGMPIEVLKSMLNMDEKQTGGSFMKELLNMGIKATKVGNKWKLQSL